MLMLRRYARSWAAAMLLACYALALIVPSLAFSFDRNVSIVHSLTEAHGGLLIPHFHHDDADHQSADHNAAGGTHHCCGALSLPGLLPPSAVSVADQVCSSLILPLPEDLRAGCSPMRLERPPRLASLT
jgi:hypothetical protein